MEVKYYKDINCQPEIVECEKLSDFLLSRFKTRDELLDLRFFEHDFLSHEIDQTGGDFLDINEGVIAVVHESQIPRGPYTWYVIIAVVTAVAVVALMPDPVIPDTGRDARSGTNRLGESNNEPRINERIDDVFGKVTKHVPSLWQVPYRIGVNDQETEVLLCCVGRGRYEIDPNEWYDGDTPVVNIPNAAVNIYEPNRDINTDTPDTVIGYNITEKVGIYRQSNDVNPTELQPLNAADSAGITWRLSGGAAATAVLNVVTKPDGFNLTDEYQVGQLVKLADMYYYFNPVTQTFTSDTNPSFNRDFDIYERTDLGLDRTLEYQISAVTSDSITLLIPFNAPTEIYTAWSSMTNYDVPEVASRITAGLILDGYIYDPAEIEVFNDNGWTFSGETVDEDYQNYSPVVGESIETRTPEFFVPDNATELLINLASPNGFYKLSDNNESRVIANVRLTVVEIDSNGDETGNSTHFDFSYNTPTADKRKPRFQTGRVELPYTRQKAYLERTTLRDKSSNVSNVDNIELNSVYSFEPCDTADLGDVTLGHVIIPSNSTSRLIKQRRQNVTLTRKITQYLGNGVFGTQEDFPATTFDQIIIHMALDRYIGRLSIDEINADGFNALRTEMTNYFGSDVMSTFGYNFDTMNMTFQDSFMLIADAVMCSPYVQAGVYDLFFEKEQTVSSMQVTCRNKIPLSEVRRTSYDLEHDGVELTYRDNITGVPETIYLPDDSVVNPKTFELKGVTEYVQALRRAKREYNKLKYQNEYVKFDVDAFGRNIIPYKRIDSPDSTRFTRLAGVDNGYRVYDGEVVEVNGFNVELSEPVEFIDGEDHYITFTKNNGDNSESMLVTQVDEFNVLLSTLPSEPIYDGYSKDRTKFILVSEQLQQSVALIPKTIEFNLDDNGVETHTVNAVNYDSRYYQNDLDTEL